MKTVILPAISNIFMTFAGYGHLRYYTTALWLAILASWGIAFFEYGARGLFRVQEMVSPEAAAPLCGPPGLAHTTAMDDTPLDGEPPAPRRPPRTPTGDRDVA